MVLLIWGHGWQNLTYYSEKTADAGFDLRNVGLQVPCCKIAGRTNFYQFWPLRIMKHCGMLTRMPCALWNANRLVWHVVCAWHRALIQDNQYRGIYKTVFSPSRVLVDISSQQLCYNLVSWDWMISIKSKPAMNMEPAIESWKLRMENGENDTTQTQNRVVEGTRKWEAGKRKPEVHGIVSWVRWLDALVIKNNRDELFENWHIFPHL